MSIRATWAQQSQTGLDYAASQQPALKQHAAPQVQRYEQASTQSSQDLSDVVIVGGVEKMTHRTTAEVTEYLAMAADYPFEQFHGITFPGLFAMMATAHMHAYGTTEQQIGKIAVKNHHHGSLKPQSTHAKRSPT